eukprot:GHVR01163289.1.p1 GENE.GHVR01163289.1~~GHVR01163289.1.p1  ORF type:complete len:550 (+),score=168.10 GHVR01163289.1:54-1652(+)
MVDWQDKVQYRDNGGSEGWVCDQPWGDIATRDTGAISLMDARLKAHNEGWRPWVTVPETDMEKGRRRRRRLQRLGSRFFETYQSEVGEYESEERDEISGYEGLPPPPESQEEEEEGGCGAPEIILAPHRAVGLTVVCAPEFVFAPTLEVGAILTFAPVFIFAPTLFVGLKIILAPEFLFAPTLKVGVMIILAPLFVFAPELTVGVVVICAPAFVLAPYMMVGMEIVLSPIAIIPDIFEDWWFKTTDFGPSAVQRYETHPLSSFEKKDGDDLSSKVEPAKVKVDTVVSNIADIPIPFPNDSKIISKTRSVFKLRKIEKLGQFFMTSIGFSVVCPRKMDTYHPNNTVTESILIFYVEPRLRRLEEEHEIHIHPECVVPYPSDILRAIPHLPKHAQKAIDLFETVENKINPKAKIAANAAFSFTQLVGEGHIPDGEEWLSKWNNQFGTHTIGTGVTDITGNFNWTKMIKDIDTDVKINNIILPGVFEYDTRLKHLVRDLKRQWGGLLNRGGGRRVGHLPSFANTFDIPILKMNIN